MSVKEISLVDQRRLRKNPRNLPYLYPSIPAAKYKAIADKFHEQYALDVAEKIARMFGCHVVPAQCFHHSRKDASRRIMIYGHNYYIRRPSEMTKGEFLRYTQLAKEESKKDEQ